MRGRDRYNRGIPFFPASSSMSMYITACADFRSKHFLPVKFYHDDGSEQAHLHHHPGRWTLPRTYIHLCVPAFLISLLTKPWVLQDDSIEQQIFTPTESQNYQVKYVQTDLWVPGTPTPKPWTAIDKVLRDEVDGIMVLKMGFTKQDLDLFPRLKVIVRMGVGYDRLDRVCLAERGVTVCNIPGKSWSGSQCMHWHDSIHIVYHPHYPKPKAERTRSGTIGPHA